MEDNKSGFGFDSEDPENERKKPQIHRTKINLIPTVTQKIDVGV